MASNESGSPPNPDFVTTENTDNAFFQRGLLSFFVGNVALNIFSVRHQNNDASCLVRISGPAQLLPACLLNCIVDCGSPLEHRRIQYFFASETESGSRRIKTLVLNNTR